jgi:hypothetical protein
LHVANNYIIFSSSSFCFFVFVFFLSNILAIPRETESETNTEREVLEKESERVLTERDVNVGKAGHAVVRDLVGGARLTESWPVVRV